MAKKVIPVKSSAIASLAYDTDTKDCYVTFHKGGTFVLQDFPADELNAWVAAPSPGGYWNTNLKGHY